ncbi:helix-turn-helix domain-containing protein [Sporolactobacillus sp. THM19-2]|uniref:helix-turn-helix domain-containing protein n=1 Tax=Sporolactobacillus sp. THM19-2 TaxID=2511171 RepID=UPI002110DB5B|nr:helix-turn-helix domain-containing protein [Sporolactobacillus sp. THM19-2]
MEKLLLYLQVHQLSEQGFKVAKIARKLGISRNTVYKINVSGISVALYRPEIHWLE